MRSEGGTRPELATDENGAGCLKRQAGVGSFRVSIFARRGAGALSRESSQFLLLSDVPPPSTVPCVTGWTNEFCIFGFSVSFGGLASQSETGVGC